MTGTRRPLQNSTGYSSISVADVADNNISYYILDVEKRICIFSVLLFFIHNVCDSLGKSIDSSFD